MTVGYFRQYTCICLEKIRENLLGSFSRSGVPELRFYDGPSRMQELYRLDQDLQLVLLWPTPTSYSKVYEWLFSQVYNEQNVQFKQ